MTQGEIPGERYRGIIQGLTQGGCHRRKDTGGDPRGAFKGSFTIRNHQYKGEGGFGMITLM